MTSPSCSFCDLDDRTPTDSNDVAVALADAYPVTDGHTLIVSRRHVATWFDATAEEQQGILELVDRVRQRLDHEHHPDGYNVGFNVGEAAGQTIMHLHVHVIPRYAGDVDDPTGGVRLVIPDCGNYRRPDFVPRSKGDVR